MSHEDAKARAVGISTMNGDNFRAWRERMILSAEQWGNVAITELVLAAKARGIVRQQHQREAVRAAQLAARYAIRLEERLVRVSG